MQEASTKYMHKHVHSLHYMHISKQMYVLFKENNDNPGPVLFR